MGSIRLWSVSATRDTWSASRFGRNGERAPQNWSGVGLRACRVDRLKPPEKFLYSVRDSSAPAGDGCFDALWGRGSAASRAGIKTRLATKVQPRLINSRVPMLAVPGCRESVSEPNAVPVVNAENRIARAVAEPNTVVWPARQFITK